jgi:DNA-nicking Smr family endonuclease
MGRGRQSNPMARKRGRAPRYEPFDPLLDAKPAAVLDLHGFTAAEAKRAVRNFVTTWRGRAGGQVVHIITGRGRGSPGRPVLRGAVKRFLADDDIARFVAEVQLDLDDGGYLVRLR